MTASYCRILHACEFATKAHGNQTRKSRKAQYLPYMVHPLAVARKIAKYFDWDHGMFETIIVSAILHDVLEDTNANHQDIKAIFGKEVFDTIAWLTDDKLLSKEEQRDAQIEKMLQAPLEARIIKIADKTCNVDDILKCPPGWKLSSIEGYVDHATKVVSAATSKQDIVRPLVSEFWEARQHVLDWVKEEKMKEGEKK